MPGPLIPKYGPSFHVTFWATFYVLGHFSVRLNNGNFLALAPILRPPDSVPLTINALLHSLSLSLSLTRQLFTAGSLSGRHKFLHSLSLSFYPSFEREREGGGERERKSDTHFQPSQKRRRTKRLWPKRRNILSIDRSVSLSLSFLRFFGAKILSTFESSSSSSLSSSSSSHLFLAFSTKRAKNNF